MEKLYEFIENLRNKPFIKNLIESEYSVYAVGGVVRDLILNKPNKDIDLVVGNIDIDDLIFVLKKFGKVDVVGKSFGVIKFVDSDGTDYDIALPRRDKKNDNGGHRGFDVQYDKNIPIESELIRRDAKFNAMAININTGKFIDPLGGLNDIENKSISAANPEAFSDDPLRMLRMISFASRFGFNIEPKTMQKIIQNADRIKEITPERILTEFDKIVKKGNIFLGAKLLGATGLYEAIFGVQPQIDMYKSKNLFNNAKTMGDFIYLLTKDSLDSPAEFYKDKLKGDNDTYKELKALETAYSMDSTNPIASRSVAHNMYLYSPQSLNSQIVPDNVKNAAQELLTGKYPKTTTELAVNGTDLMNLGLKGKEIGDMQKSLLIKVYSDKVRNNKEELLSLAGGNNTLTEDMNVLYSAVVLDEQSHDKLVKVFRMMIPEGWEIIAHHMTINMGAIKPEFQDDLGDKINLSVIDYAIDDKVMAVGVEGYPTMNAKPHITIAVNRSAGGKPVMSNNLTDWKEIKFKLELTGIVTEIKR